MKPQFKVVFPRTAFSPVVLPAEANLSEHLTVQNSPVLFGCRTGICGTCISIVSALEGELRPPDADELDTIDVHATVEPSRCRLLCQMRLTADVAIEVPPKG